MQNFSSNYQFNPIKKMPGQASSGSGSVVAASNAQNTNPNTGIKFSHQQSLGTN